jgi:tetratricopeptide (TPR) repeat protein
LLADLLTLDDKGRARPTARTGPSWNRAAAILLLGSTVIAGTWWFASPRAARPPPAPRAALPVLIVDFQNRSGDGVFDGVLEQALGIAMEGAPFITAFPRREAAALVRDLKLGSRLDEGSGRLLAHREGIPVILAGTIEKIGAGYKIAVRAVTPEKPEPLTVSEATASDKAQVLGAVERVAESVRAALGDTSPFKGGEAETFTTTSLAAVRAYTVAQDLSGSQKDTEAVVHYREALRHDPEFGRAYSGLAASCLRLGRREEAHKNWDEALRRTDRMTEREKLRTFGGYYLGLARNYDKAIETYEELVAKFPSDSAGLNNLAIAYFSLLKFDKALEYGGKAIKIYPKTYKYRANYALYAMYAGDFSTAATVAQALIAEDPKADVAFLPLAMAALTSGDSSRARATYHSAANAGEAGASASAIGLADVAMYEARYADAIAALPAAVRRDEDHGNILGAAAKLVALAEAYAARGQQALAAAAMTRARKLSDEDGVLVPAARLAVADGRFDEARAIAILLAGRLPAQSRAYSKVIEAKIAMSRGQFPAAIDTLNAAQKLADLWLGRFTLGIAYFQRGDYPEAASEFAKCVDRRGEATALFLDDSPTFRYFAPVPYWLGRAREMQKLDARSQFQEYLRIRQAGTADPLVDDARRRLQSAAK